MPSDVPGVRSEIESLIGSGQVTISDDKLEGWASRLRRDPPISNRSASRPMDMDVAREIRRLHGEDRSNSEIAAQLNVNHGRVSEVMTGAKWQEPDEAAS